MTRVSRDFGDTMQKEAVPAVSADVIFASSRFPNYKIGSNNQIVELKDDPKVLSMKEVVARETAQLLEQQKRLSVRDLASKFEKGLAAAAKLSEEARLREAASLEKHVLLKKLRDALESLKGRVAGRNKDDVEEAISMVEALAVQLTQREGELMQEKTEVKKLANFLKQASEDARRLVDEERAFARAEIEAARAAVQRVEEALQDQERMSRASGKQDLEELMKEVQEARRIKMLHQPSKVMDMEHELQALRKQLTEKSKHYLRLQKELAMSKRGMENNNQLYEIDGTEALGSYLQIQPCSDNAPDLSRCSIQWYRISSEGFLYAYRIRPFFFESPHNSTLNFLKIPSPSPPSASLNLYFFDFFGPICLKSISFIGQEDMGGDEQTLVEILEEHIPIDFSKYINYVSAPQAGAIATFSGTTRDTFDGKDVVELRYEAYVPMALKCVKTICSSARSSWNLHSMAVAHRLGPVPVGETSVFIAVSSVHRADALDACKYVIDEVKASVPIWKKEVYSNGEVWKENSEFLERRLFGNEDDGSCSVKEVEVHRHERKKGCCGAKVKVIDECGNDDEKRCFVKDVEVNRI